MNIAIYLPLFILLFVILNERRIQKLAYIKIKKRRGVIKMTYELIKKYIGENCIIGTLSLGSQVKGKITEINENWLEVETKKGNQLVNIEFIQSIKIL